MPLLDPKRDASFQFSNNRYHRNNKNRAKHMKRHARSTTDRGLRPIVSNAVACFSFFLFLCSIIDRSCDHDVRTHHLRHVAESSWCLFPYVHLPHCAVLLHVGEIVPGIGWIHPSHAIARLGCAGCTSKSKRTTGTDRRHAATVLPIVDRTKIPTPPAGTYH